jgi:hypothetical protein
MISQPQPTGNQNAIEIFGTIPQLSHQQTIEIAGFLGLNPSPFTLKRIYRANLIRWTRQYLVMPKVQSGFRVYTVFSQTFGKKGYTIVYNEQKNQWSCSCPDFAQRGLPCKHILTFQPRPPVSAELVAI